MKSVYFAPLLGAFMVIGVIAMASGATHNANSFHAQLRSGGEFITIAAKDETPKRQTIVRRRDGFAPRKLDTDGGRWCEYKKVKVYDRFHNESYFIDKKVCLKNIIQ